MGLGFSEDGALQSSLLPNKGVVKDVLPTPSLTFEGIDATDEGNSVAPPDTNGDVGPNDYVQTVNNRVRIWDKNGNPRGAAFTQTSLFSALGGICSANDKGDPVVLYDRIANRWLISQFAFTGGTTPPFHECIAISKSPDPTGAYFLYDFITPGTEFPDYPKFGVWPDGYYMTSNQFNNGGPFDGVGVFAFDRLKMIAGDPTAALLYFNLNLASHPEGIFGVLPADQDGLQPPPAGAPNPFVYFTDTDFGDPADGLRLFDFHADFTTPANSTFIERAESTYATPLPLAAFDGRDPGGRGDIEQPPPAGNNTTDRLDSIGSRLMFRLQYINRGGTESLVGNFTVNVSGVAPTSAVNYQAGIRYFELRKTAPLGLYAVNEQATFAPGAGNGATGTNRWNGSAAMDSQGNLVLAYTNSSTTLFPSLTYAARAVTDPPNGLFQGEGTLFAGTNPQRATGNRWGDYSALVLDPKDDCTFWDTNEYYSRNTPAGFDWQTRVGTFKFPTCATPEQGTLTGTITACDTGVPIDGATVTVSGGPSNGFSTTTVANGTYSMQLAPGTYTASISSFPHSCSTIGPFNVTITNGGTTPLSGCLTGSPNTAFVSSAISGGNGNGIIEADECNSLNVTIKDIGCITAPNVSAVLSTTTPNVTITQPNSPYPNIAVNANGTNTIPFSVSTSPSFVCGTPVALKLTVTYTGGSNVLNFTLPSCACGTTTVSGSLAAGDLQQVGRMGRNGVANACNAKVCPGAIAGDTANHFYDLYTFTNGPTASCVTITTTASCSAATNPIITVAYLGSFNPANLCTNYLGDPGGSPAQSNSFAVNVPANATLLINVQEITAGTGCSGYSLNVGGLVCNVDAGAQCQACAITPPANITVSNDPNQCGAVVNYPAPTSTGTCGILTSSPASGSFFPKGTTTVTVTSTSGASSTFTVTVNDTQNPTINCPANISVPTTPGQPNAIVNYPAPTASDNCPGVVTSCDIPSGSTFPTGTTVVTCTATDTSGNTAECSFNVTVQPQITINDVSLTEGNSGSSNAVFTVTLSSPSSQTVTVDYFTSNGTATEPGDYTAVNGTLTFLPGITTRNISVPVNGDPVPEANETFFVNLQNPTNAGFADAQGQGTILDDDSGGTMQFSAATYSVNENTPLATITVTRTGSTVGTVTVNYATSNGTATAGSDYGNTSGTLTFGPGVTSQTFDVPILDDTISEGTESVNLTLSGPTGGGTLGSQINSVLLIIDNEPPPPNSITVYAVTVSNNLLSFNNTAPNVILSNVPITGMQLGENVVGIDFRPANGQLYALGSLSRLYTINTTTGVATAVGGAFTPLLTGVDFGSDFNPVVDRLRVVSDADQNFRLNPVTGAVASSDTSLAYASGDPNFGSNPNVVGASYTNSFAGASSLTPTTLYGIDSNLDTLVRQGGVDGASPSPNAGQLFTIGSLGVNTTGLVGFDIQGSNNRAFAALNGPGESFSRLYTLNLGTGAASLSGTIGGGEMIRDISVAAGAFQFSTTSTSVSEGAGKVTLTVTRTGNTSIPAAVNFSTTDGTATQKGDYTIALGTVQFAAGDTSKSFDIFIIDDGFNEPTENFTVALSAPTNDFSVSGNSVATVNIADNDPVASATNPIDDNSFFVRQHYLDFLNREPDSAGFAFWKNQLDSCGADAACLDNKRQNVSAAFFLSIEFQETGAFALRIHRAAFGRKSNDPATRAPYLTFMRDARQVGNGVIIGQPGADAQLEANKQAYADQIVNSAQFIIAYPTSLTAAQFVDNLFAAAGVTPTTAERNAAINAFGGGGTSGRIAALRSVADSNTIRDVERNPAFVLMQYFGYLRRGPTDPPDNNDDGYQFWLTKLNNFNGNFVSAEMVKAFLVSSEYRGRFR